MIDWYYKLLGLDPGCTAADAKKAYHALAKKTHPDFFPEADRHKQQLKMIRLNEAYMVVLAELGTSGVHKADGSAATTVSAGFTPTAAERSNAEQFFSQWAEKAKPGEPSADRSVGTLRDPAYAYYKNGFRYFREGTSELTRKEASKVRRFLTLEGSSDRYILLLALRALHFFERSYSYFLVVVEKYGDSPWALDASRKISRIQKFSQIYQRICDNLARPPVAGRRHYPLRDLGGGSGKTKH